MATARPSRVEVVLGLARDLLDEAVESEAGEQTRHLGRGKFGKALAQGTVAKAGDVEVSLEDDLEDLAISLGEEVEAAVGASSLLSWVGDAVEGL